MPISFFFLFVCVKGRTGDFVRVTAWGKYIFFSMAEVKQKGKMLALHGAKLRRILMHKSTCVNWSIS